MAETAAEIEENFALLDGWEDRYRYIIELGAELPPYPQAARDAAHKVNGCVSQVWLLAAAEPQAAQTGIEAAEAAKSRPILRFQGDSDAHIVKGLVYIILALYSGKTAADILAVNAEAFLARLKLQEHLTPQRSNGLRAMVARIRAIAEAALPAKS